MSNNEFSNTPRMKWFEGFAFVFLGLGVIAFGYGIYKFVCDPATFTLTNLGEYLGGSAGSLWALSGLLFLYVAFLGQKVEIRLQQKELRDNRKELKGQKKQLRLQNETMMKQQFENTFFELLKIHRDNVALLEFKESKGVSNGKKVFEVFYRHFKSIYEQIETFMPEGAMGSIKKKIDIAYNILFYGSKSNLYVETAANCINNATISNKLLDHFRAKSINSNQSNLGHYFRHLYQTVTFIHNHPYFKDSKEEPYEYVKKLRAQLSDYELAILYLNSQSSLGKPWTNTDGVDLITEYSLIKTLPSGFFEGYIDHRISFPKIQYEGMDMIFSKTKEFDYFKNDRIQDYYIVENPVF